MTSIRVARFYIFIFTILAFTLNGCLLPGIYGPGRKGVKRNKSLSGAVESGNTKSSSKSFPTFPTPPLPPIEFVEIGTSIILSPPDSADESNRYEAEPHTPPVSRSNNNPYRSGFSASLSTSITGSKQIENLYRHTLQFDTLEDRSMLSVKLSFTNFTFDDEWIYSSDLEDPWAFDLGLDYKYFLTKESHFIQPFIGASCAYGQMYWSYVNSIVDTTTGETIDNDSLEYLRLEAITGIDLRLSRRAKIGFDLRQDFTFHSVITTEGFVDDIFEDFGSTTIGARFSLLF